VLMPPPDLLGAAFQLFNVALYLRLLDMWQDESERTYPDGEYTLIDCGRDCRLWHDQEAGDGYFYCLQNNDLVGWQWKAHIDLMACEDLSDDVEEPSIGAERFEGEFTVGQEIQITDAFIGYSRINDVTRDSPLQVTVGIYLIEDAGMIYDDDDETDRGDDTRRINLYRLHGLKEGSRKIWACESDIVSNTRGDY